MVTEPAHSAPPPARSPGWWLQVAGAAHVGVALTAYRRPLLDLARRGLLASVPDHGERATAFWFLANAPLLWTAGRLLRAAEARHDADAQRTAGTALAAIGALGTVAMPASGFWAIGAVGIAALRRARPTR